MSSAPAASQAGDARFAPHDAPRLRRALGRFATGVTVITARGPDGRPLGFTANSFSSVSLDPPLILWSLSRGSERLGAYRGASAYAVNILTTAQEGLARQFASAMEDRFEGVEWEEGLEGAPVIPGARAVCECLHEAVYPAGDHELFIGRVEHVRERPGKPLTFFGGGFGTVMGELEPPGSEKG